MPNIDNLSKFQNSLYLSDARALAVPNAFHQTRPPPSKMPTIPCQNKTQLKTNLVLKDRLLYLSQVLMTKRAYLL